jgi:thiol:disulfide interchange protein DsbC
MVFMNTKLIPILLTSLLIAAPVVQAADQVPAPVQAVASAIVPGHAPDSISPAPIPGFYEVVYGSQLVYVSADGRYLLHGDVIDLKEKVNLTEKRRSQARVDALAKVAESDMVIFAPKGETKHTVTVFTDVDCGYCRKFHHGMKEMNQLGIRVRYLAYPRAGIGSGSYKKAEAVWCAKDRKAAMNQAKAGREVASDNCKNPVAREFQLGNELGVTGTPTLILEDGRLLPGYVSPKRLLQILDRESARQG